MGVSASATPVHSPTRSSSARRHHRARVLLIALVALFLTGAVSVTRILFSPQPIDQIVASRYLDAIEQDPAHAALYSRLYGIYDGLTSSDTLHYVVHRVAEGIALATGHNMAAQTQAQRASAHDDSKWIIALRDMWHRARQAVHR
jgi:hypothetical protein